MNEINSYQKDQIADYQIVLNHFDTLSGDERNRLLSGIAPYLDFRQEMDTFLTDHFAAQCTATCFQNNLSACCAKDSIIIFFADIVINVLVSSKNEIRTLMACLSRPNTGKKCIYLGDNGCTWHVKPIVCAGFLCDRAQDAVFQETPGLREKWEWFRIKEKEFKWPDRPVLFDMLEEHFITAGYESPSMYLHKSPGLLRVKKMANRQY